MTPAHERPGLLRRLLRRRRAPLPDAADHGTSYGLELSLAPPAPPKKPKAGRPQR